jgi:hypothetical protein
MATTIRLTNKTVAPGARVPNDPLSLSEGEGRGEGGVCGHEECVGRGIS